MSSVDAMEESPMSTGAGIVWLKAVGGIRVASGMFGSFALGSKLVVGSLEVSTTEET